MKLIIKILSFTFLIILVGGLVYNNMLSPNQKIPHFDTLFFPAFMFFSFVMMFIKRKKESGEKSKLSDEDRKLFGSIESVDKKDK